MLKSWLAAVVCVGLAASAFPVAVAADDLDARADAIIASFTVDQLVGQMNQIAISSLLETKTNNLNETAVRQFAKLKVGSYLTSIPWVFGPMLEIAQNPLWARNYESFGEDPYLVSVMADAIVRGLQSNKNTAACMKHFVGYSKTQTGHDKDGVTVSDFDLLNYYLPPFLAATKAGVLSAMENYISVNGVPTVANKKLMTDLLRHDMGFEGLMVTDYAEVNNLFTFHRIAKTRAQAVELSIARTTVDMSMVANNASFVGYAKAFLEKKPEYLERVRASARRI
ncbi:hypothetical protein PybrP1_003605, partial [[Pythium] brassicae (nom. inval.)]